MPTPTAMTDPRLTAIRAEIVHFLADPAHDPRALEHFADGVLIVRGGHIAECGPAPELLARLPAGAPLTDYRGKLILPGFVDTHVHYPQTDIIASHGEQLLEWLEKYTFPAERRFANPAHAAEVADFFCAELLRNGTTTAAAAAFATVHAVSVDALFEAARAPHAPDHRQGADESQLPRLPVRHRRRQQCRIEGADRALARPRPPALRRHPALRADLEPRADAARRPPVRRASRRLPAVASGGESRRGRLGGAALPRGAQLPRRL